MTCQPPFLYGDHIISAGGVNLIVGCDVDLFALEERRPCCTDQRGIHTGLTLEFDAPQPFDAADDDCLAIAFDPHEATTKGSEFTHGPDQMTASEPGVDDCFDLLMGGNHRFLLVDDGVRITHLIPSSSD